MAGPAEILIVAGVFLLVGVYLYIASRFLRADNAAAVSKETKAAPREVAPLAGRRQEARAH